MNYFQITIFNPGDYPDNTSGGVSEVLIAPKTESFIKLDASTFYSTEAVRYIDLSSRKCLFTDETNGLPSGYTYSDCLVDCRVNEIIRLCNCRPFYVPRRGNKECKTLILSPFISPVIIIFFSCKINFVKDYQAVCDTSDAKCLQKYKSKTKVNIYISLQ